MNKQKKDKLRYREQTAGYQRGRRGEGKAKMGQEGQIYGDGWELGFSGEHAVGYTSI